MSIRNKIALNHIFLLFMSFSALANEPIRPGASSRDPVLEWRDVQLERFRREHRAFMRGATRMMAFYPSAILGGIGGVLSSPYWLPLITNPQAPHSSLTVIGGSAVIGGGAGIVGY